MITHCSRLLFTALVGFFIFSCGPTPQNDSRQELPSPGTYTGILDIQGTPLIFSFDLTHTPMVFRLDNHKESFEITEFTLTKDSLIVPLHIFDAELRAAYKDSTFTGFWTKNYVDGYHIPFVAKLKKPQPLDIEIAKPSTKLAPKYRVYFESELEDSTIAVALFQLDGNELSGTFMTETGDYRYLKGRMVANRLKLTTFDGEHAFVFTGEVSDDGTIEGTFLSGKNWHEKWTAIPDDQAALKDLGSLTYLKDSFKTLSFKGLTATGEVVTPESDGLKRKPILLQIMGSWCPNCMDETAFLSEWAKTQRPESLQIVSIAFEKKPDLAYGWQRLKKLQKAYDIDYQLLFGGIYHKDSAAAALPELNDVIAYPTLIFMDANHEVKHIHTGFNGPGTGEHFERWKLDFEKRIAEIAP